MERLTEVPGGGAPTRRAEYARMPALSMGTQSHRHSIHSALATLAAIGVPSHRISVLRSGREAAEAGTVVRQDPAPGTPLPPDTHVRLHIAGLGFTHALPVGMWDSGGETHAGTREVLEGLDDPLEKLAHWFHEGAPLFRIAPDDLNACARWLTLFGVDLARWPQSLWYRLATLVAGLARYSCSQDGVAVVLETRLGLPVQQFRYLPQWTTLPDTSLSMLGSRASRLGVDMLVGDAVENLATLEIELGPVPLATYEYFTETKAGPALLRQTMEMVLPASTDFTVRWVVLDQTRAPRLGMRESNSRLGVNTYMGDELSATLHDATPDFDLHHAGATI